VVVVVVAMTVELTPPLEVLAEVVKSLMVVVLLAHHVRVMLEETVQNRETMVVVVAELQEQEADKRKVPDDPQV
jgi:hypothetical protein